MLNNLTSKAAKSEGGLVEYGYGQVEPNHLSAQRTGQIYAQLPADAAIDMLENGQFVKYDYANGLVNFTGEGEWMLVYNEPKLYREFQNECEFALKKGDHMARIYSPVAGDVNFDSQARYYGGVDSESSPIEKVTAPVDYYEPDYTEDPFHIASNVKEAKMPGGTSMIPRVFKTNVGDIFTTNLVKELSLVVGDKLSPRATDGILAKNGDGSMTWQVVKVYTLPDHQKAVKLMRIA